jgi:hypothetical protein
MSALERLTAYLCSNPRNERMDEEYAAFAVRLLNQHAHELAEKVRQGGVRYDLREFNAARAAGPGRVLEFVQSAIADFIDPEAS